MSSELTRLEDAYRSWHDCRGRSRDMWAGLMAEQLNFRTVAQPKRGFSFAQARQSREAVVDHLTQLTVDWDMEYFLAKTFVEEGNRIAMFGAAKWRNRATGRSCEVMVGHMWRFRDGLAVELIEVFDSARVVAAMAPEA